MNLEMVEKEMVRLSREMDYVRQTLSNAPLMIAPINLSIIVARMAELEGQLEILRRVRTQLKRRQIMTAQTLQCARAGATT